MGIDPLNIAVQGLNAAQRGIGVVAQNVANASTPGYTRKTLQQYSVYAGDQGAGVVTGGLTRDVNTNLQSSLWAQNSVSGSSQTSESYLNQLQQLFGTPDSDSSFAGALTSVQNDFVSLDSDPSNNVLQSQVVNDAEDLTNKINSLAQNIQGLRTNAVSDLSSTVGQVNQLLSQVASLNTQIAKATNTGQDVVDLQDQRDLSVNQLSQYMNISTYIGSDGTMTVSTATGTLLADTQAQTLSYTSTPVTAQSYYPASINGIMVGGTDITSQITSGTMGSLISLRDTSLPQAQAMLDETAQKLASRFSAQNVKLFTDASGNVPANTPTTYAGFSSTIQINPAVLADPTLLQKGTAGGTFNASDNTNIQNVLNYAFGANSNASGTPNTPFNTTGLGPGGNLSINMPASGPIVNFANNVISTLSEQYSQASSDSTYQTNYQNTLQKNMLDSSGVSVDTEMSNLIQLQNAYGANAKIITSVQQMFTELLQTI